LPNSEVLRDALPCSCVIVCLRIAQISASGASTSRNIRELTVPFELSRASMHRIYRTATMAPQSVYEYALGIVHQQRKKVRE
jgi:hypothetical protein